MTTFPKLFNNILTADKETSRKAAREVRKFLYSAKSAGDRFEDIKNIINSAPEEYSKISESWRQENFVMAISVLYFLHDKESNPDFLFRWLFHLLQHENGYIRHAAVRMMEHELGPLTYHIRFPGEKSTSRELSTVQADRILYGLFVSLHNLLNFSWKPAYKRYKYIDSLPSSTYKSVQMILSEFEEDCGEEYMKRMEAMVNG